MSSPSPELDADTTIAESARIGLLFGAPWCPIWSNLGEQIRQELGDQSADCLDIDVDQLPHLADRYLVVTLPTVLLLEDGRETARLHGAFSPSQAVSLLRRGQRTDQEEPVRKARR